jgi:hypothetical protein
VPKGTAVGNNPESAEYICVENGESFMVSVHCQNKTDVTTYGAVLYLDGKKVPGKKTFQRRTLF